MGWREESGYGGMRGGGGGGREREGKEKQSLLPPPCKEVLLKVVPFPLFPCYKTCLVLRFQKRTEGPQKRVLLKLYMPQSFLCHAFRFEIVIYILSVKNPAPRKRSLVLGYENI